MIIIHYMNNSTLNAKRSQNDNCAKDYNSKKACNLPPGGEGGKTGYGDYDRNRSFNPRTRAGLRNN